MGLADKLSKIKSLILGRKTPSLVFPPEIPPQDVDLITRLLAPESPKDRLTLLSLERLCATSISIDYIVCNNIPGDVVECGVWRGGTSILMAAKLANTKSSKTVFLFDTFEGMTKPTWHDVHSTTGVNALSTFNQLQTVSHNEWCFASFDDVQSNIKNFGLSQFTRLVKGPVEETLLTESNLPSLISLLRLDTDWYESTKLELDVLYERVAPGGVILIDDYGHWDGARRAVDEFIAALPFGQKPLMWITDRSGRGFIKPLSVSPSI